MKTIDIVNATGVDRETLRFYESKGLLTGIKRTQAGHRLFPEETVSQIQFVQMAKQAGFTLAEIKELIDLQKNRGPCRHGRDMAKEKRIEISQKMKALKKMDKVLSSFIHKCEKNGEAGLSRACHFSFELKA
ncbi:MAG: MerR family transcriptional regulator [Bdellovibrionales bacterium]|nr:MerR family transcriptional regulator [Bdellovibrionales bacterium]